MNITLFNILQQHFKGDKFTVYADGNNVHHIICPCGGTMGVIHDNYIRFYDYSASDVGQSGIKTLSASDPEFFDKLSKKLEEISFKC
jgi:hypothetical protein